MADFQVTGGLLSYLLGKNLHSYAFPLVEADQTEPDAYRTDLREFFQAMQCRRQKEKLRALFQTEKFRNIEQETGLVIARHLHVAGLVRKMEEEELPMCIAFEELMEEERAEGKKEGLAEGKKEGLAEGKKEGLAAGEKKGRKKERRKTIRRMIEEGFDEPLISRLTGCTKKEYAAAARR